MMEPGIGSRESGIGKAPAGGFLDPACFGSIHFAFPVPGCPRR